MQDICDDLTQQCVLKLPQDHNIYVQSVCSAFLRKKNFSKTKFANLVKEVYSRFRDIYKPQTITLEEMKKECRNGVSTDKEKAAKADDVMG